MMYTKWYTSPLGRILLACDDTGITGLWFEGQKHFAAGLHNECIAASHPLLQAASRWLDIYFGGCEPEALPPLHLQGTAFQLEVWGQLCRIPYGKTATYGDIAAALADQRGCTRFSAQAVGGAVGRNPISILIPCHRVVGRNGSLTGYAGGLERKLRLLQLEQADTSALFIPML